jgi:hypothetical protein
MPVSVEEIAGRLPPVSHLHSSFHIAHIEYLFREATSTPSRHIYVITSKQAMLSINIAIFFVARSWCFTYFFRTPFTRSAGGLRCCLERADRERCFIK